MFQLFELFNPDTTSVKCAIYPWVRHLFISPDFSVPVFEHFGPGKKAEFEPATIGIGSANLPEDDSAELMALQLEVAEMAQEMTDKMSGMVTTILSQIIRIQTYGWTFLKKNCSN